MGCNPVIFTESTYYKYNAVHKGACRDPERHYPVYSLVAEADEGNGNSIFMGMHEETSAYMMIKLI
jgi:hypothetical protein